MAPTKRNATLTLDDIHNSAVDYEIATKKMATTPAVKLICRLEFSRLTDGCFRELNMVSEGHAEESLINARLHVESRLLSVSYALASFGAYSAALAIAHYICSQNPYRYEAREQILECLDAMNDPEYLKREISLVPVGMKIRREDTFARYLLELCKKRNIVCPQEIYDDAISAASVRGRRPATPPDAGCPD